MTFEDHYSCTEPLLRAELGTLWLAEDRKLRRPVAVALLDDPAGADRFLSVANVLAEQPNLNVRALDRGTREDGAAFFVIEPPPGAPFAERLLRVPQLLVEDVTRVALEVLSELEGVHAAGAAHGRIDPSTVWVASPGKQLNGRLVGLGLYRAGVEGRSARELSYAAPELLRGGTFGPRCDVWSMGVLLYECFAGEQPFARASVEATRAAVLAGPPASVATFAPELPVPLVAAIEKAMAHDPAMRFEDAKSLRRAIFIAMLSAGKRGRVPVRPAESGNRADVPAARASTEAPQLLAPPLPVELALAPVPATPELPAVPEPRARLPKSTIVGYVPPAHLLPPRAPRANEAAPPPPAPSEKELPPPVLVREEVPEPAPEKAPPIVRVFAKEEAPPPPVPFAKEEAPPPPVPFAKEEAPLPPVPFAKEEAPPPPVPFAKEEAPPPPPRAPAGIGPRQWRSAPFPGEPPPHVAASAAAPAQPVAHPAAPTPLDAAPPGTPLPSLGTPSLPAELELEPAPRPKGRGWIWATAALAVLAIAGWGVAQYVTHGSTPSAPPSPSRPAVPEAAEAPAPAQPSVAAAAAPTGEALPDPALAAAPAPLVEPDAGVIAAPSEPVAVEPAVTPEPIEPPALVAEAAPEPAAVEPPTNPRRRVRRVRHARPGGPATGHTVRGTGLVGDPGF